MVGSPRHMTYQYGEQTARIMNNNKNLHDCTLCFCSDRSEEDKKRNEEPGYSDLACAFACACAPSEMAGISFPWSNKNIQLQQLSRDSIVRIAIGSWHPAPLSIAYVEWPLDLCPPNFRHHSPPASSRALPVLGCVIAYLTSNQPDPCLLRKDGPNFRLYRHGLRLCRGYSHRC